MNREMIIVLDFGGQYNQLIARRVRECNVYCEVHPYTMPLETIKEMNPKGIIFTGGPNSVYLEESPHIDKAIFDMGIPILGICYGSQLMAYELGGQVATAPVSEYGKTEVEVDQTSVLFKNVSSTTVCWMSHTVVVDQMPEGFTNIAVTDDCQTAAIECREKNIYGVQFHPEVMHTEYGMKMLENFLFKICGFEREWKMSSYAETAVKELREQIKDGKVLLGLSGGVDSSVAAALLHKAVGDQLTCIFVDHGMLRKNEGDDVERVMKEKFNMKIVRVNAQDQFLSKLKGVSEPEKKRKIIGEEFIRVFEAEAKKIGAVDFLVQGTIYPDVVESGTKTSAVIKSHHNVGGLPDHVDFKEICEPLRELFKDEVRQLGIELGLPEDLVWRQPFPGPGLAVRIIGEITEEKLRILKDADAIFREEIAKAGLMRDINQYFAVLTDMRSVGVMGDERTYDYTLALRGVVTSDFMTAEWARIPYEVLDMVSRRIINETKGINRIVYDITSKPPATIEWE